MRKFHKPVKRPSEFLENLAGSGDPAASLAHSSAAALLHRTRTSDDPDLADRIVCYAAEHGIDDVAELWASAGERTLPRALWQIYLLRHLIAQDPVSAARRFEANAGIVGESVGPEEILEIADDILRGVFTGDFAMALDMAGAFCLIQAADEDCPHRLSFQEGAVELPQAAELWRKGKLN